MINYSKYSSGTFHFPAPRLLHKLEPPVSLSRIILHLHSIHSTCIIPTNPSEAFLVPCQSGLSTLLCCFQAPCEYLDPNSMATCMSQLVSYLRAGSYHLYTMELTQYQGWINEWMDRMTRERETENEWIKGRSVLHQGLWCLPNGFCHFSFLLDCQLPFPYSLSHFVNSDEKLRPFSCFYKSTLSARKNLLEDKRPREQPYENSCQITNPLP